MVYFFKNIILLFSLNLKLYAVIIIVRSVLPTVPIPVIQFSVIKISYDCIFADLQFLIFKWYLL